MDRLYLNLYQPRLQHELGVVGFFRQQGFEIASSALMEPITARFVRAIHRFVKPEFRSWWAFSGVSVGV